mmetsp:Transcript_34092/g.73682  ORF Transcript_34092/g.73682 Transcript_34092/m.73682 type:complete len:212 (+) Transcript_34092:442-1077(+)
MLFLLLLFVFLISSNCGCSSRGCWNLAALALCRLRLRLRLLRFLMCFSILQSDLAAGVWSHRFLELQRFLLLVVGVVVVGVVVAVGVVIALPCFGCCSSSLCLCWRDVAAVVRIGRRVVHLESLLHAYKSQLHQVGEARLIPRLCGLLLGPQSTKFMLKSIDGVVRSLSLGPKLQPLGEVGHVACFRDTTLDRGHPETLLLLQCLYDPLLC